MQALSDNLKNNTNENFKRIHNGAKIINDGLKSQGLDFTVNLDQQKSVGYKLPYPKLVGQPDQSVNIVDSIINLKSVYKPKEITNWCIVYS